jgi:hypothetical protein
VNVPILAIKVQPIIRRILGNPIGNFPHVFIVDDEINRSAKSRAN